MNRKVSLKGILFDFDGLIIDSESAVYQAWKELYRRWDKALNFSDWQQLVGKSSLEADPMEQLAALVGSGFDRQTARDEVTALEMEHVAEKPIRPGVEEIIARAQREDLKLGIASSSTRDWVLAHLSRLGLRAHFQSISCADDVEFAKPDPALYRLSLKKLGLNAHQVIVFEDSPNGVLAAKRAGLFCVAVPNPVTRRIPYQDNGGQPDLVLDSLRDFPLEQYLREGA